MYKLYKTGAQANTNAREYIVDSVEDIASLPESDPFGSIAIVIGSDDDDESKGLIFIKNSTGTYVQI